MAEYALPALVSRLKIDTSGFKVALETAGLAVTALAAAVVAFGVAAVEKTVEAGQAAFEMSEKFGLAKDQASAWLAVGPQIGVTSAQIGIGFKTLAKNIENMNLNMAAHVVSARQVTEASQRLKLAQDHYNLALKQHGVHSDQAKAALLALEHAQDAFNKVTTETTGKLGPVAQAMQVLGLNAFDAFGKIKDGNEIMLEAADAFAKAPQGFDKAGIAVKLFGKSGTDLIPMLNLGRKGIEDLMAAGKSMGTVMGTDQVEAAHKMFLAQKKLNAEITGFTMQVGTALMPVLLSLIDYLTTTAVPGLVAFAKPWIAQLTPAITDFYNWLVTLRPQLQTAFDIIKAWAPFILAVAAAWAIWNVALAVTKVIQMGILAVQFVAGLYAIVRSVGFATVAQWAWNFAMTANPIGVVVVAIAALVAGLIWAYKNVGWFHDAVNVAWDGIKRFAEWIWTGLKPILDWLGQTLSAIASAASAVGNAIGSVMSAGAPGTGITGRAGGGMVVPGGIYTVGERGPETLVMGSSGGRVIPNGGGGGTGAQVNLTINVTGVAADIDANIQRAGNQLMRDFRAMLRNGQLEVP